MRALPAMAVLAVFATVALSAQAIRNFPRMTIDELKPLMAAGTVLVVDVRRPEEFAQGHVPGAVNVDYTRVLADGARYKNETRTIVTYCACSNEMTAARAAVDFAQLGLSGVKALRGGWDEWIRRGEPVEP